MEEESDIDLTECSAGEGSSQEADSTPEDNGIEPMVSTILNTEKEIGGVETAGAIKPLLGWKCV